MESQRKQRLEDYKSATNIIKYVGPRGGFKQLSFEYKDSNEKHTITQKQESEVLIGYIKELNLKVEEKLWE